MLHVSCVLLAQVSTRDDYSSSSSSHDMLVTCLPCKLRCNAQAQEPGKKLFATTTRSIASFVDVCHMSCNHIHDRLLSVTA